jgi:hypothetical protein
MALRWAVYYGMEQDLWRFLKRNLKRRMRVAWRRSRVGPARDFDRPSLFVGKYRRFSGGGL